jgi:ABC-type glycerol-3-phosphate transport system substrate-binding protein
MCVSCTGSSSARGDGGESDTSTLSISILDNDYLRWAAIVRGFNEIYPNVKVTLNTYAGPSYEEKIGIQLMAGTADDLLLMAVTKNSFQPWYFVDLFELMRNDPSFDMDDSYMNIFEAFAENGMLVWLPKNFYYFFVGVNNTVSQELVDKFKQYDAITFSELMSFYNDLEYTWGRNALYGIDPITVLSMNYAAFVDFENRTCDFNNDFVIDLITDANNLTSQHRKDVGGIGYIVFRGGSSTSNVEIQEIAARYLFKTVPNNDYQFFVPNEEVFTHFIPLLSENGKLMVESESSFGLGINAATENKEMAWEFIKYVSNLPGIPTAEYNTGLIQPVYTSRAAFRDSLPNVLDEFYRFTSNPRFSSEITHSVDVDRAEVIERLVDMFDNYNQMPMQETRTYTLAISGHIYEILTAFQNGLMTAEQAVSEIQNKVSLALME